MVKKVITNLDSSKASCPDFIPVVVLKSFCKYQLNSSICVCLSHCSLAVPGERSIAKNYHPISLLSVVPKTFRNTCK